MWQSAFIVCVLYASYVTATPTETATTTTAEYDNANCSITPRLFKKFFKAHVIFYDKYLTIKPLTCLSCNKMHDQAIVALCPYHRNSINISMVPLKTISEWDSNDFCKNLNRTGHLCSKCDEANRPSLSSYSTGHCLSKDKCHDYHWLTFFAVETIPATVMYITFMAFNVQLTSGYANGFILYSQIIAFRFISLQFINGWEDNFHEAHGTVLAIVSLYSLWSFQLGHIILCNYCVNTHIPQLMLVALQYTSVFYALLLAFLGYIVVELHSLQYRLVIWLSKPFSLCFRFHETSVDAKTVSLNTLAAFYYMGFAKLAALSIVLLKSTPVYNETGQIVDHVSFYDGSLSFMRSHHLPYAVLAIAVLIFLVIIPVFLMIFYQFQIVQKCLRKCHLHRPGLMIFMDALQGCYRDGSEGGKDFRWFSFYYYFLRVAIFILSVLFLQKDQFIELHIFILLIVVISITLLLWVMPYKYKWYNRLDIFIFSYCSFILGVTSYQVSLTLTQDGETAISKKTKIIEIIICILIAFPLVGAAVYVLEKLFGVKIRFLIRWYRRYTSRDCDTNQSLSVINDTPPPLLRTISGTSTSSLPDRMIQPEVYRINSRGTTPDYGSVHRSLF